MGDKSWEGLHAQLKVLNQPLSGKISLKREHELDQVEAFHISL